MARTQGDIDWVTYGLSIGNRLRTLRQQRGLTQEKLAELSGLHRNQVSNIERNRSRDDGSADPQLSTIFRLALALDVAPLALIPSADQRVVRTAPESVSEDARSLVEVSLKQLL